MAISYPRPRNFTERSHRVIELASEFAAEQGHEGVTPLHIAIGLIREGQGVAATALQLHGLRLDLLEQELAQAANVRSSDEVIGTPLARESAALVDQAAAESRELGHRYVGTEHILLALLRDPGADTGRVLAEHGFSHEMCKARVLYILNGDPANPLPFVPPTAV